MLVGEEAVRVIAAVLDVLEAAAVHGADVAARPWAAEPAHQHLVGVEVAAALGAHAAAPTGLPGTSAPGREVGGGAASGRSWGGQGLHRRRARQPAGGNRRARPSDPGSPQGGTRQATTRAVR